MNTKLPNKFSQMCRSAFAVLIIFFLCASQVSAASLSYVDTGSYFADMSNVTSEDGRYIIIGNTVSDTVLNTTENFHVSSSEVAGNGSLTGPLASISDDGRYVAFLSTSTNLDAITPDTNAVADVFVRDRTLGTTVRASVSSAESESDAASTNFQISGNGRFVAFDTAATNIVAGDGNASDDVFLRDLDAGTTSLVSADAGGDEGDSVSIQGSPSYDGRYVAFQSFSTDLVPGYNSGTSHIYVKDTDTNAIEIVSIEDDGTEGNSFSRNAFISGNGSFVTFESVASNLVANDTNGGFDIFVYDRDTDTIELVSKNSSGVHGDGASLDSSISYDGRYVYLWTNSTNFATIDATENVFVYDRTLNTIELITKSMDGTPGNVSTRYGAISADGLHIVFSTDSTNLVSGFGSGVYLKEINQAPTDIALSNASIGEHANVGDTIGSLTSTDANEDDAHTYSLACSSPGADDASFAISGSSLVTNTSFNFEDRFSYAICLRSNDGFGGTFDENFTVTITDEQESSGSSSSGGDSGPADNDPAPEEESEPDPEPLEDPQVPVVEPEPEPELEPEPEPVVDPDIDPEIPDNTPAPETEDAKEDSRESEVLENLRQVPRAITGAVAGIVNEIPKGVTDTVSVVGVALPTIVFAIAQPAVAANIISVPLRLWNLIPIWLGLRRKKRPWGTVYDSVTKQPLDPVVVTLKDASGAIAATTITDIDGRFGFLVAPGTYTMTLQKDDYIFPSQKLLGKTSDDLYHDLYAGETIEIRGEEDLLIKNIPMDAVNFNWNEFEKAENKELMRFYSKRDLLIARIASAAFAIGLIVSLALAYAGPSTLNYVVLGIYAAIIILRVLGVRPKKPGLVVEAASGIPLSLGIVRVFSVALGTEIAHAVIGKTGKYYALVPKGTYYVRIDKKTGENSYAEVFRSEPFVASKGFIGNTFKV